jgi:hypothetical protein
MGCSSAEAPADGGDGGADASDCFACSDVTVDVPLLAQVRGVLLTSCRFDGCHEMGAGNLSIAPDAEFTQLIDVPSSEMPGLLRVRPGDPAQSYAYLKLACEGGIMGSCMPLGGHLDPTFVQTFHDWVESGAPTH